MKISSFDRLAHATDAKGFIILCILLRFAMAYIFLYASWDKFMTSGGWSAAAYLQHASGPLALWFQSLAGNTLVDGMVMYGEFFIGLSFLFGALIKPAAFFAMILMVLFYGSAWVMNTAHGLVSQHVIYALVSGLFLFGEFGHWYGLDYWISRTKFVQSKPWLLQLF